MTTIAEFMASDHKACDEEFATAETSALTEDWDDARAAFKAFRDDMARHFRMEEEILFPALADAGGPAGPVQVMLMEHEQIRELLRQMDEAAERQDGQEYSGLSETLLMVMQQHNYKEENILYPIADHILAKDRGTLLDRLQAVGNA